MGTLKTYVLGFLLSIVLTLVAFGLVQQHVFTDHVFPSHTLAVLVLVVLAVVQLFVQLILFLHVGKEEKPRWNLLALLFALLVVFIVVGGSLWIMQNLQHGQISQTPFEGSIVSPQT